MADVPGKSEAKKAGKATVGAFRPDLGTFVVAARRARMPMILIDEEPGHPVIFANDAFLALTGHVREDVLERSFQSLLADGVDTETMPILEAMFQGECNNESEIHYTRKDGSEFWASVFVCPVCDENGEVVQQFASFVDLTIHRQDSARCKMLIDELNHRVKNTLATVQFIVTQALRRPADPVDIREAIESRILALSRSHDLLTTGKWEGAALHDLVDIAMEPFEGGAAKRFTIVGANLRLSPRVTLSLAIALHELATNAVKYGAFSNDAGRITIGWTVAGEAPNHRLVLHWREHDGPTVRPPTRKGFGSWVIERGLAHQLGGKVTLEYASGGVACTIDIPAPNEAGA